MRTPLVRVKLLVKHSRTCHGRKHWPDNPWAYFGSHDRMWDRPDRERIPLAMYLTADGKKRKGVGGDYRWLTVGCNDSDCPGVAAVREEDLLRIVQANLKTRPIKTCGRGEGRSA